MQTDALRALYETRRTGSIRKAGEELGLAASSVSRHIRTLERQFGPRLLDRSAKGVALTYAGERVAEYARSVLNDYESLKVDLDD
jgi:molybdate transport repressor ModE-like protein